MNDKPLTALIETETAIWQTFETAIAERFLSNGYIRGEDALSLALTEFWKDAMTPQAQAIAAMSSLNDMNKLTEGDYQIDSVGEGAFLKLHQDKHTSVHIGIRADAWLALVVFNDVPMWQCRVTFSREGLRQGAEQLARILKDSEINTQDYPDYEDYLLALIDAALMVADTLSVTLQQTLAEL